MDNFRKRRSIHSAPTAKAAKKSNVRCWHTDAKPTDVFLPFANMAWQCTISVILTKSGGAKNFSIWHRYGRLGWNL